MARLRPDAWSGPVCALVEPVDQLSRDGDAAVVPVGRPIGGAISDGLGGHRQVLLPGGGQGEYLAAAAGCSPCRRSSSAPISCSSRSRGAPRSRAGQQGPRSDASSTPDGKSPESGDRRSPGRLRRYAARRTGRLRAAARPRRRVPPEGVLRVLPEGARRVSEEAALEVLLNGVLAEAKICLDGKEGGPDQHPAERLVQPASHNARATPGAP